MVLPNMLGLDDDLDGVEVVRNLEVSFGVKFSNKEAEDCRTVSDILKVLHNRLTTDEGSGQGCASAMAFYRLRRALTKSGIRSRLAPTTALDSISESSPKAVFRQIHTETKMRLPGLGLSGMGQIGLALLLGGLLGLLGAAVGTHQWAVVSVLVATTGAVLMRLDPGRFPASCKSLGDLARKVAGLNFGAFLSAGAGCRERDVWSALIEVLSEHSSLPKTEIREETVLLRSQLRAAR